MSRHTVIFTKTAAATVTRLAADANMTVAEVVRRAVAREAWYRAVVDSGGRILVEDAQGDVRAVEFTA